MPSTLSMGEELLRTDPDIAAAIDREVERQDTGIELIASENFTSNAVLQATASVFTNKYAEGYPGRRYYGGCEFVDVVERLARKRVKELFGAQHANVQPHSGSQANQAVYFSTLKPGDRILGMDLAHGGHLTHGHPLNVSGILYEVHGYGVGRDTETIDYARLEAVAREVRPKLIISGASAYSRTIDFERIGAIAREVGARHMADIAHIAGLVAVGEHPSPVPHADYVTSTTHKTLRGPRSGIILCRKEHAKAVDRALFPGLQGGPLVHVVAAKAVAFREAASPDFAAYQKRIIANAARLCAAIAGEGFRIVSGGTDNHMFLVDVFSQGITGADAEKALEAAGITVNKNAIPFDENPPMVASGIRVGTPAVTTRGMGEEEMDVLGRLFARALRARDDEDTLSAVRGEVRELCAAFPLPYARLGTAA
ncbi:MAG: serine hydroxymethyltransferase [Acidobacteriota bacterium]|jgi:glycine hydroxymethyltransferase